MVHHYLLERTCAGVQLGAGIHGPESGGSCHLIVATATGVKFRGDISYLVVEHAIDERVDILVGSERLRTRPQFLTNQGKPALDALAFFQRKDPSAPERNCPRLA